MSEDNNDIYGSSLWEWLTSPQLRPFVYRGPTLIQFPASLMYLIMVSAIFYGGGGEEYYDAGDSAGRWEGSVGFIFLIVMMLGTSLWVVALLDWLSCLIRRAPRFRLGSIWLVTGLISNMFVMGYIWDFVENKFFSK